MKTIKLLISLLAALWITNLAAQTDTIAVDDEPNVVIKFGDDDNDNDYYNQGVTIDNGKRSKLRLGMLDVGVSTYLDEGSLNLSSELDFMEQRYLKSLNFGIHIVNMELGLSGKGKPQKFSISTGARLNIARYGFEDNFRLREDHDNLYDAIEFIDNDLKKNRLLATYFAVPILIDFNSRPDKPSKSFNLSVGYVQNILLGANHKIKSSDLGKEKVKDNFNLNKALGMAEVRVGYGPLNFFLQYGLGNLFQDGTGPELVPINFGINVIPR